MVSNFFLLSARTYPKLTIDINLTNSIRISQVFIHTNYAQSIEAAA